MKLSLNEVNGEASQNDSLGGNQILTSFHNRISTVVIIVQLMNEIADKERVLNVSTLIDKFKMTSTQIREHLKEVEVKLGVKRGESLVTVIQRTTPQTLDR